jgi:hypothetical protein
MVESEKALPEQGEPLYNSRSFGPNAVNGVSTLRYARGNMRRVAAFAPRSGGGRTLTTISKSSSERRERIWTAPRNAAASIAKTLET